jgi:hypothetical protein
MVLPSEVPARSRKRLNLPVGGEDWRPLDYRSCPTLQDRSCQDLAVHQFVPIGPPPGRGPELSGVAGTALGPIAPARRLRRLRRLTAFSYLVLPSPRFAKRPAMLARRPAPTIGRARGPLRRQSEAREGRPRSDRRPGSAPAARPDSASRAARARSIATATARAGLQVAANHNAIKDDRTLSLASRPGPTIRRRVVMDSRDFPRSERGLPPYLSGARPAKYAKYAKYARAGTGR